MSRAAACPIGQLQREAAAAIGELLGPLASLRGLQLPAAAVSRLASYAALLLDENARINLTASRAPRELVTRHLADAVEFAALLSHVTCPPGGLLQIADIGSGGGLPGIPLALLVPGARVTLIESVRKKAAFLKRACEALQLEEALVLCERAETLGRDPACREHYHAVLMRACAALPVACEYGLPLLRPGGVLLSPKGPTAASEALGAVRALELLGGRLESIVPYRLPECEAQFQMIVIAKQRPTPAAYPRLSAAIAKKPL